jgi:AraC-like DNA-binding protein/mannose-6-phosphate isomerase-like protein (cupin superfamily)
MLAARPGAGCHNSSENLHYRDLMRVAALRLADAAHGAPYHAALLPMGARGPRSLMHTHIDYHEAFFVLGGSGRHWIGDSWRELRGGDLTLVRDRDRHAFSGTPPGGLQFINVAFGTSIWRDFVGLTDLRDRWDKPEDPPCLRLRDEAADRAEIIFRQALSWYEDDATRLGVVRFLAELAPLLATADSTSAAAHEPPWLTQACAAMRQEEHLRAGLPRLLDMAAVSHGYLARSLRRYRGQTPVEFVMQLRIRHAATLLITTDLSIENIATRSGFTGPSYFSRSFRRARGISPREFRAQARRTVIP